jgi:hypothetical protein
MSLAQFYHEFSWADFVFRCFKNGIENQTALGGEHSVEICEKLLIKD